MIILKLIGGNMLNKKGFTLIEVLTVIIVISLIMMVGFPALLNIMNKNNDELYKSYEKLMIEYVKAGDYQDRDRVYLSELEGLDQVKEKCTTGYVDIIRSTTPYVYQAHITCGDYVTIISDK